MSLDRCWSDNSARTTTEAFVKALSKHLRAPNTRNKSKVNCRPGKPNLRILLLFRNTVGHEKRRSEFNVGGKPGRGGQSQHGVLRQVPLSVAANEFSPFGGPRFRSDDAQPKSWGLQPRQAAREREYLGGRMRHQPGRVHSAPIP